MKIFVLAAVLCIFSLSVYPQWVKQSVDTTAGLRGLAVVSEKVVWASGTSGTVIRTIDGGNSWSVTIVPGAEKVDFRDIEAFDANTAYVLSIGNGESSRIYKTSDGGKTWKIQFKNTNEKAFFDAIACWDRTNCIAMSDPVDGHFVLISTSDGGDHWTPIVSNQMPAARDGEAAFAASGTCLITHGKTNAFLISGGTDARVFRSMDRGVTWTPAQTPIVKGTAASGIFSIAMIDTTNGIIVGGDYEHPELSTNNLALTRDGGSSWTIGAGLSGYRSGVAYADRKTLIAVGSGGSDISVDGGRTWRNLDRDNYNSVQAYGKRSVWAVGAKGLTVRLSVK